MLLFKLDEVIFVMGWWKETIVKVYKVFCCGEMKRFAIKTDDGVEVYSLMWGGSQDGQGWSEGVLRLPGSTQRDVTRQEQEETLSVLREQDGKVKTISCFLFYLALSYLILSLFYSILFYSCYTESASCEDKDPSSQGHAFLGQLSKSIFSSKKKGVPMVNGQESTCPKSPETGKGGIRNISGEEILLKYFAEILGELFGNIHLNTLWHLTASKDRAAVHMPRHIWPHIPCSLSFQILALSRPAVPKNFLWCWKCSVSTLSQTKSIGHMCYRALEMWPV